MSKAYINGTGCISPQPSTDPHWFPDTATVSEGLSLSAIEPSYKEHIAPNLLRRMGRAIKMGVAAANVALKEANRNQVDAIATGTGLGCFEDSERFLLGMIDNDEQFLTPTSFIQSTHNTVASQIALILKCHEYNFTYVHRGFSFESALTDALMWFDEGKEHILVGGIEEFTPIYVDLYRKAGKLNSPNAAQPFWAQTGTGYQMGEGATFFAISAQPTPLSKAAIAGLWTVYKPKSVQEVMAKLLRFLEHHGLGLSDIDLVLMGFNGDATQDQYLRELLPQLNDNVLGYYKHLCGEYHTASAFATWLAARLIEKQEVPPFIRINNKPVSTVKRVLVLNQYLGINYSFILLEQC